MGVIQGRAKVEPSIRQGPAQELLLPGSKDGNLSNRTMLLTILVGTEWKMGILEVSVETQLGMGERLYLCNTDYS